MLRCCFLIMKFQFLNVFLVIILQFSSGVYTSDICSYCHCDETSAEIVCSSEELLLRTVNLPEWSEILIMRKMILRHIPHFAFNEKLKTLRIISCHLSHIHPFSFSALPGLQTLDLSNNLLSELPDGCFHQLSNLKILDLSRNKFRNLDLLGDIIPFGHILERFSLADNPVELSYAVTKYPIARELRLSNTNIHFMNDNSLVFMRSTSCSNSTECRILKITPAQKSIMRLLDVSGQSDFNIHPSTLDMLSNVTILNLSGAKLPSNISLWLSNMSQAKSLNLSGSFMSGMSRKWNACGERLRSLDISGMNLTSLEVTRSCKLRFIKATDNCLNSVYLASTSLETILLDNNQIHSWIFPPPGVALSQLKTFSIAHNLIKVLPSAAFSQYPQIQHLNIAFNRLSNLSTNSFPSIGMQLRSLNASNNALMYFVHPVLPSLTLLDLSHNNIYTIHSHLLIGLPMLQYFYLQFNHHLFSLCSNRDSCWLSTLSQLTNLIELDLSECNLEILPDLKNLYSLRRLHLSNNKIHTLDGHLLPNSLHTIDLTNNDIHFLSNSTIKRLKEFKEVGLAKNPLICDCRLSEIVFLFNNHTYSNQDYYCFRGAWQYPMKTYIERVKDCTQTSASPSRFMFLLLLVLIAAFLFSITIIMRRNIGCRSRIARKYTLLDVNAVDL